jgi:1-acyl-sn-glycerol-3-phosphate acyltransferase
MPEARVIPIDGSGRRNGRRSGDAAGAVSAGAARATGERARRRPTGSALPGAPVTGAPAAAVDDGPAAAAGGRPRGRRDAAAQAARSGGRTEGTTPAHDAARRARQTRQDDAARAAEAAEQAAAELGPDWERRLAEVLAFLRRRLTGDYDVDEFGFDPELNDKVLMAAFRPLYQKWFRVETRSIEHVPADGSALIVANHSGTVAVDSVMTQLALLDHHPAHRHLRMLGADLVFDMPFVGEFARKGGTTLACNADAERLLGRGEVVGVWPEGFKGTGKPFRERYKLQRFGRGGFVAAALRTGAPIIPVSIVGAEEIYPILGNMKTVARMLGVPYVPITPTFPWLGLLGLVPLPSKWIIEFGEPIDTSAYGPGAADDPMLVFNLTDQVRETIQHTLYKLLMQRRSVFF